MRVSSLNLQNIMLRNMHTNSGNLNKLMGQIATGQRITVPSDDPVASTRLVQLERESAAREQYQKNISRLSGSLSIQESNINGLGDALAVINDKLIAANNDAHPDEDMGGFGKEISAMIDMIVSSMNASNEDGHYYFGGTNNTTAPVVYDPDTQTYTFVGNTGGREVTVGNGLQIKDTTDLSHVFSSTGSDLELLNQLKQLSEKMQDPNLSIKDYKSEMQAALGGVGKATDKQAALYADLGGRQNQLSLLHDIHEGVKIANDGVANELAAIDPAEAYSQLGFYMQVMKATNDSYVKISHLSLFDSL